MNEKQRSTTFNIITTLLTKFILLFGGFIISIMTARFLGPTGQGIITAVFVFPLLIVSLADMGIRQSTAYFIGTNKFKLNNIISSVSFLWIITSFISVILVSLYFYFGPSNKYSWLILLLAIIFVPLNLIEQYSKGIMQGRNQISTINIAQLVRLGSNFIALIILVWILDLGVLGATIAHIVFAVSVAIYYLLKIKRYGKLHFRPVKPIPEILFKRGFSFALVLFIINLNYKISVIMLDFMVSPTEIGIYSVGSKTAELLWQIPSAIGMVLFSKSAVTKNQLDSVKRSITILRIIMPVILLISLAISIFAPFIIGIFFGEEFLSAGNVLRLMLPGICLITISKVLHPDLAGRGYPLYALKVFLTTLVINVIINFVLIPSYGIYGAAISSTISYSIAGLWFGQVYAKKENIKMRDLLFITKKDIVLILNSFKKIFNKGVI